MSLYWFSRSHEFGKVQEFSLFDCIECGCCSYVCPSHIPLVQYFRFSKSEIWARERENKAAEKARERHEFREFRQEREKQEKAERLAAREKALQAARGTATPASPDGAGGDSAQDKIRAAIEHARAQAASVTPKNTDQLTAEQQADIAAIEARRARSAETAQSNVEHPKE